MQFLLGIGVGVLVLWNWATVQPWIVSCLEYILNIIK